MATFGIKIDIKDSLPRGSALTQSAFPNLATAVWKVSEDALAQWQAYARGEPLPDGRTIGVHGGTYLRSIQLRTINDFSAEVFSELPYASSIEEGAPARDMKRLLGSSWKVRVNKKGKRYLIIPFRHDTPNSVMGNPMPQILHEWWQGAMREESRITDTYDRVSGAVGHDIHTRDRVTVAGWRYRWGSRLDKGTLSNLGITGKDAKRLSGMVNFREQPHGEGARHSRCITFRVMSEDSKGWQAPAREGYWPAKTVAEKLRPVAEDAFRKAIAADLRRALGGG